MQPSVCINGLGGCLGHLVVAFHDVEAAGHELAVFPIRKILARLRVDDLALYAREGRTDSLHAMIQILINLSHRAAGRTFSLSIDGENLLHIHLIGSPSHQFGRAVGTCHDACSHVGEIRLGEVLMVEHGDEHRRYTVETGYLFLVYAGQR